jgi:hypothetical protein
LNGLALQANRYYYKNQINQNSKPQLNSIQ